jgi:hypothetical protein
VTRPLAVQDEIARDSAAAMYYARYSEMADTAQMYAGTDLGATVAATAMLFLVAADAEVENRVPSVARDCGCFECRWYRLFADKSMPSLESFTGIGRP